MCALCLAACERGICAACVERAAVFSARVADCWESISPTPVESEDRAHVTVEGVSR